MAKRSTDLLEVFNRKSEGGSGSGRKRGRKRSAGGKRRPRGAFEGLFLGPRQVLLVCCVLLLLLVLSFVVGIGIGRKGEGLSNEQTALSRQTAEARSKAWYVRGRMVKVHQIRGERIGAESIPGALDLNPRYVRVLEARDGFYDIFVGPFPTEAAARAYWRNAKLEARGRKFGFPFGIPSFLQRNRFEPGR